MEPLCQSMVVDVLQNIMFPDLGKSGQPYAKSVTSTVNLVGAKPDAGVIFDSEYLLYYRGVLAYSCDETATLSLPVI